VNACALTIVGGGREAWSVWGRGTREKVWARGALDTWSRGPSTSPLGIPVRDVPFVECIAERKLVLRRDAGPPLDVTLEIGRPLPLPHNPAAIACPFRLVGLEKVESMYTVGVDSAQALQLVFRGLPSWLAITGRIYGGKFEAFGGSDHAFGDA